MSTGTFKPKKSSTKSTKITGVSFPSSPAPTWQNSNMGNTGKKNNATWQNRNMGNKGNIHNATWQNRNTGNIHNATWQNSNMGNSNPIGEKRKASPSYVGEIENPFYGNILSKDSVRGPSHGGRRKSRRSKRSIKKRRSSRCHRRN